jgi:hypothetical protein
MPDFTLNGMSALLKGRLGSDHYSKQIAAALALAYRGHQGQLREQADPTKPPIPYIVHPVGVALIAAESFTQADLSDEFDDVIAACLTHDLLEDTDVSPYELERATSRRTLELVTALSRASSSDYPSREERNAALLDAIKRSGKTAVFIKICDSMHNLSRPELTPLRLLEKTAIKGRGQYLRLIEESGLSKELVLRYQARLDDVSELVSQARSESLTRAGYHDINAVFSYCRERTKRKILETHDVVDILKEVTSANEVLHSSMRDFAVSAGIDPRSPEASSLLRVRGDGGEITRDAMPELIKTRIAPATRMITVAPKGFGDRGQHFILLLGSQTPTWVSGAALVVLATFLLERALLHETGRTNEMADTLSANSIQLDAHLAIEAGLAGGGVKDLARHLEGAAVAKGLLDSILMTRFPSNVEARIAGRESRIKSAESTVRKMMTTKTSLEAIEDLLGYRFIVRNVGDKKKLTAYLEEAINRTGFAATSTKVKVVRTPRGYVADHLTCAVKIGRPDYEPVAVEIQVRTILDDAWARVSLTIDYKKNNAIVKRNERVLKKLRVMIDDIEEDLAS